MKRELFRRYVWLVDVIRHAKKITFDELSALWDNSPLNAEKAPLALRTFHNHREAIEHLFGLRISCDRSSGNRYYIDEGGDPALCRLKVWMLQTLSLGHLNSRMSQIRDRIMIDEVPEEKFGVLAIVDALETSHKVILTHSGRGEKGVLTVDPYGLRFWHNSWFLVAYNPEDDEIQSFDLRFIETIAVSPEKFHYPARFSIHEHFSRTFGPNGDPEDECLDIRLKVNGRLRDRLRAHPLHPSQTEVKTFGSSSIFDFQLIPTEEFMQVMLSLGPKAEVLSPASLRDSIRLRVEEMAKNYSRVIPTQADFLARVAEAEENQEEEDTEYNESFQLYS